MNGKAGGGAYEGEAGSGSLTHGEKGEGGF